MQDSQVLRLDSSGVEVRKKRRIRLRNRHELYGEGESRQQLVARHPRGGAPELRRKSSTTEGMAELPSDCHVQGGKVRLQEQYVVRKPQLERSLSPRRDRELD